MTWFIDKYQALIPSANRSQERFMATLAAMVQPFADIQQTALYMPSLLDIDNAVGDQLDICGEWIGLSRIIKVPITDYYLTLDTAGLGLDQGRLFGQYSPTVTDYSLDDAKYKSVLRAKILANSWDGTIAQAYDILNPVMQADGSTLVIYDNQDMTMYMLLIGGTPSLVTQSLFLGDYLNIRPAGVKLNKAILAGVPVGTDINNSVIGGLDIGYLLS